MSLNRIDIMGRLTKDVELRRTTSGTAVANFPIAVERDFKNDAGEREVDFIEVVAWRGTAEFAEKFLNKGRLVVVTGRLQIRKYTDKDGIKRQTAEVVAESIYFADSKPAAQSATSGPVGQQMVDVVELPDDDDDALPF